jgi:hypothetical protein
MIFSALMLPTPNPSTSHLTSNNQKQSSLHQLLQIRQEETTTLQDEELDFLLIMARGRLGNLANELQFHLHRNKFHPLKKTGKHKY